MNISGTQMQKKVILCNITKQSVLKYIIFVKDNSNNVILPLK